MSEYIGIKGILEGINKMLDYSDKDDLPLVKKSIDCAKSMLNGVIKELTPIVETETKTGENVILDSGAQKAREELET